MPKICIFAGTTEGRHLAEFLSGQDVDLTVSVATEYGASLLKNSEHYKLINKRLSALEIKQLISSEKFELVIDATHPYASEVTDNILSACKETDTEYQRVLRQPSDLTDNLAIVSDIEDAVNFLNKTEGNILLTTGSKELPRFMKILGFSERVFARVLPMESSLKICSEAGLKPSHIIAMQGPFSEEMNIAMLRSVNAQWLVTKESGDAGGFDAKVTAAKKTNAGVLVIGRPTQTEGIPEADMIAMLCLRYGFRRKPHVSIIGIGPGNYGSMTNDAIRVINNADCLIGAGRMLASAAHISGNTFEAIDPQIIAAYIHSHQEMTRFAVLMSGDSGFYSGTQRLLPMISDCDVDILPGISSLSYLCAKLQISYENIEVISLHGRDHDFLPALSTHSRLFLLTGGLNSVQSICRKIVDSGLCGIQVSIGERLGYPDEKISIGEPVNFVENEFDPLSVILIENDDPDRIVTHGLPDELFNRDSGEKGIVPMTKSGIRSVCISKLALTEDAICWDIGSGTGSVTIEMALQAKKGIVYAIEKDVAAIRLSKENAARCHAFNINFIHGSAPDACRDLPSPTHVFIGGSSENIDRIIQILYERKAVANIVATAVSLETIAEMNDILSRYDYAESEVSMIQIAHGKKAGSHHLMLGENPVYIFSMRISG